MTRDHPSGNGPRPMLRVAALSVVLGLAASFAPPSAAQSAPPSAAQSSRAAPTPAKPGAGESFEAWCARLRRAEPFVPFRCTREDDWTEPGHPSRTHRIRWAGSDVAQAFELARALFGVPASLTLPRTGPREQTIEDPRKPPEVWESTLALRRAADASLREARWFERREGSGRTVTARRIDSRFVEVSEVAFAD
jgi:hypothetical protein